MQRCRSMPPSEGGKSVLREYPEMTWKLQSNVSSTHLGELRVESDATDLRLIRSQELSDLSFTISLEISWMRINLASYAMASLCDNCA